MEFFRSFLSQIASVAWVGFRYLLVSLTVMLVTLSVVTKRFPPPVMSVYHSLKNANSILDFGASTSLISKANSDRQKLLKEIEGDQKALPTANAGGAQGESIVVPDAEQKIKSLEYEVALLKSKLYRAEWEAQQLRTQREPASTTAAAATK